MGADVEKPINRLVRAAEPALRRLLHLHWRFSRGLTLGVRAVVIDAGGKVFLVRHSYVSGWHLPGGGVEPGAEDELAGVVVLDSDEGAPSSNSRFIFADGGAASTIQTPQVNAERPRRDRFPARS